LNVPNDPPSAVIVSFGGPSPLFVVMEITPPMASEPYSPLCGPRRISTRAISPVNSWPKSNDWVGLLGSETSMPSISTLT